MPEYNNFMVDPDSLHCINYDNSVNGETNEALGETLLQKMHAAVKISHYDQSNPNRLWNRLPII